MDRLSSVSHIVIQSGGICDYLPPSSNFIFKWVIVITNVDNFVAAENKQA